MFYSKVFKAFLRLIVPVRPNPAPNTCRKDDFGIFIDIITDSYEKLS